MSIIILNRSSIELDPKNGYGVLRQTELEYRVGYFYKPIKVRITLKQGDTGMRWITITYRRFNRSNFENHYCDCSGDLMEAEKKYEELIIKIHDTMRIDEIITNQ